VSIALFVTLPIEAAAVWSLLGGYLLLPSGTQIDIPMLPPIDKTSVPAVATLLLCWMKGTRVPYPKRSMLVYLLALGYVIAPIFTSLDNSYELQTAAGSIPGFYPLDSLKIAGRNVILLAPFYVGSRFLCTDKGRLEILKAFPVAALFYSIPMFLEVRLSPQFHRWVYGYFPHSFVQQWRGTSFRPVVFLTNGLEVALFASMALIAAVILARRRSQILGVSASFVSGYLVLPLLLCKSLGATLYSAIAIPIVVCTKPRTWVQISCCLLMLVCTYPLLRTHNIIPVERISSAATVISADRSQSFETRVNNEKLLLAKANQKRWFGWGTWGRNLIYDPYTGKDVSVTDGGWIIEFGVFGWLGYVSFFGLFAAAVFRALGAVDHRRTAENVTIGGLALLVGVNVIDMLPNSEITPLTLLAGGAIASGSLVRARRSFLDERRGDTVHQPDAATA
jgi:hypothetical protein